MVAPAGEVIRKFLPKDKPALILVDELLNYISRNRKSGLATQLYNFIQNLSEEARGNDNVVLVASIPASEMEMSAEDQACLLYTSDAADDLLCVDLGGRRLIKKKNAVQ